MSLLFLVIVALAYLLNHIIVAGRMNRSTACGGHERGYVAHVSGSHQEVRMDAEPAKFQAELAAIPSLTRGSANLSGTRVLCSGGRLLGRRTMILSAWRRATERALRLGM